MKYYRKKASYLTLALAALYSASPVAAELELELDKMLPVESFLYGNKEYRESMAAGVSADGRVIILNGMTPDWNQKALRYNSNDGSFIELGTLKSDNSGESYTTAISANGQVVVGHASTDSSNRQAFRHNAGDARLTGLGTLKSDNSGHSAAVAVSANGNVVVGYSGTDIYTERAFRHNAGDLKMTDLGTLMSDNTGLSYAVAVSADGRVVTGHSTVSGGNNHAFVHYEGDLKMTDLGTLRSDNQGYSQAHAVSADGRVIVGSAETDNGNNQAFKHYEGNSQMTGLGTLKSDNSGHSAAVSISANGLVVIGNADTDSGSSHAFRYNEGDSQMTDLGTLASDNSGYSNAAAVSANGLVVIGYSATDSGENHAFKHTDASGMVDLGTLGGASSQATAVSADGLVIVGHSLTADNMARHAFIYKNRMLDMTESQQMLDKAAEQQTAALSFLQYKLTDALAQGCRPDEGGNSCFSAGAKYYQQSNKAVDDTAAYLSLAHYFQPQLYAGVYLEQSVSSGFADSIDARNQQPLVSLYAGFSPSGSQNGLNIYAAAATYKTHADITRPNSNFTEAGKGSSNFKGYSAQLSAAYGLQLTDNTRISPEVGLRYSSVGRDSYTEAASVDFPAEYGKMNSQQTNLFAGVKTEFNLNQQVDLYVNAGIEQLLDHSEQRFTAKAPYLGGVSYRDPQARHSKAYASTGLGYKVAANQKINVGAGYRQSSFASSRDAFTAQVGYSLTF